ncbi:MAG: cysteine desulfurase family protein [Erysipelotrichaceae bacterium]|nr:cysteine desulfurase family protein [Erysipelotrichaceae bacterium]
MIYVDYASTTPTSPEVLKTYHQLLDRYFANSESLHQLGMEVSQLMEKSRQQTASLLHVLPNEVIFTSGASEANSLAVKGTAFAYQHLGKHIITSKIEHSSVLNAMKQLEEVFGFEVTYLPVDEEGKVSVEELKKHLRSDTILCSIMYVNNEVGSIQPISEIKKLVRQFPNCHLHVDCVQALGKLPIDFKDIDLATLSAHKIYGLKGSGVLIKKQHIQLIPLINGGQQEFGLRGGTENACTNILFAKTLRMALENQSERAIHVNKLNAYLRNGLKQIENVVINSPKDASDYILSFSCLNLPSEVHMNALNQQGIYVSAQSTCGSKSHSYSYVLEAMGIKNERLHGVIRLSFSHDHTFQQMDEILKAIKENVEKYGI